MVVRGDPGYSELIDMEIYKSFHRKGVKIRWQDKHQAELKLHPAEIGTASTKLAFPRQS